MLKSKMLMAFAALLVIPVIQSATAGESGRSAVKSFYDFLSNPGSEQHAAAFQDATSESWESVGDYSGRTKSRDKFIGQLKGFSKLIPDLNWAVEEMFRKGNRVVVRSRATGTPQGALFGVDGKGKSFDIMAIDIHTLEAGKITRSYHVEDWAGALRQLKSN